MEYSDFKSVTSKDFHTLEKWQLDIIKRLPTSQALKEQILREEYGVDWNGNVVSKEREIIKIKKKKSKRKVDSSYFKSDIEDVILPDA